MTQTLVDGSPVTDDHREINPETGMQKDYVVLSAEERAKGYIRPVRQSYVHTACKTATKMALPLAETYACNPEFYTETYCRECMNHFPVAEFVWQGTSHKVGS